MTSLLACKNFFFFFAEHPNQAFVFGSVRFGSEVPCSANFRSVRRFGYSTNLIAFISRSLSLPSPGSKRHWVKVSRDSEPTGSHQAAHAETCCSQTLGP